MLVKNISNTKAQIHEAASQTKASLVTFLSGSQLSGAYSFKLLTALFGPNTTSRLSVRKHVDLVKVLCLRCESEQVQEYFEHMRSMFETPNVDETFGKFEKQEEEKKVENDDEDEEEEGEKKDEKQKSDIIRTFALNQIANIPTMFKNHLQPKLLNEIINFLVQLNYYSENSEDI